MVVDLAVAEEMEQTFDLFVTNCTTQSDVVDVDYWNEHGGLVREDAKMEEPTRGTKNRFFFNLLYNAQTVVRVNDLVANLK